MKYTGPKPAAPAQDVGVDTELVEALAKIATRLGLSEIEIAHGDMKIRIARQFATAHVPAAAPAPAAEPVAAEIEIAGVVKSPMVGTAYRRASPESAPFVEIGSVVKAGDKLLLVEAMKTFNEIVAPRAGSVTRILVEDGSPVEYGQPLFVIE
ncbi:acetyl-CoA carboxylase, biotin carboxyl carrier protein [Methylocella silvestris BL2]|uniref:Biotin carboxyl carrier protein of acetyl-CoA carboxylase n=1 Tax=Methylocella silvestris (strain DSM 15510 / CIP 108128 / LMG 27833 / NCIMB 13906 / BL2) TaxID=395965 RepID=B8EMR2_METSB|nr:acetyl-CoA carboxylase biotin carboxyl carrier protein subunit [Methylocella silvestris]ACK52741.1 acetyl-CoA carboxylase, biotin carboxyl carrier protein [Methylocella silvestris BL2]